MTQRSVDVSSSTAPAQKRSRVILDDDDDDESSEGEEIEVAEPWHERGVRQ